MRAPLLLVLPVLIVMGCSNDLPLHISEGSYEFDTETGKLAEAESWKLEITPFTRDSIRKPAIQFFPADYYLPARSSKVDDTYYVSISDNEGLIEISANDSVRFIHPYNSFLATTGAVDRILRQNDETWFETDHALYRVNGHDTMHYAMLESGYPLTVGFAARAGDDGIWVNADDAMYLIRDKAAIKMKMPENILQWFRKDDGIVGYSETGKYTWTGTAMTFTKKAASEWFPELFQNPAFRNRCSFIIHEEVLYALDRLEKKIVRFADDGDVAGDFNAFEITGISTSGELWSLALATDSIQLQVAGKDWLEELKTHHTVTSRPKAVIPDDQRPMLSFLRNNQEPVIITCSGGVFFYKKDTLLTAPSLDCSHMRSFLELQQLAGDRLITGIHNDMWSRYLLSKATLGKNGSLYKTFNTNADSRNDQWIADHGSLTRGSDHSSIVYDIDGELRKRGITPVEELTSSYGMSENRVYINKRDVVHIFGNKSLTVYDIPRNAWQTYDVCSKKYEKINPFAVFEDKNGFIWFEVEQNGIYCFDGRSVQHIVPLNDIIFWQIDPGRRLSIIREGRIQLMDLSDVVPDYFPIQASFPIDHHLYDHDAMQGIIWENEHPIVINSYGFYFYR